MNWVLFFVFLSTRRQHHFKCGCCRFFFCSGVKFGPASELYCSPPNTRSTNRLRGAPATPSGLANASASRYSPMAASRFIRTAHRSPRSLKCKCLCRKVHMVFQGGQSLSRQSLTGYCAL
ncbi:hypothetical protein P692DRAFT_20323172 [Suillus brevipes Sb2]|nr:hypothetical protein P692DRAFT_20323172 [Suillus brevipes Sb2]